MVEGTWAVHRHVTSFTPPGAPIWRPGSGRRSRMRHRAGSFERSDLLDESALPTHAGLDMPRRRPWSLRTIAVALISFAFCGTLVLFFFVPSALPQSVRRRRLPGDTVGIFGYSAGDACHADPPLRPPESRPEVCPDPAESVMDESVMGKPTAAVILISHGEQMWRQLRARSPADRPPALLHAHPARPVRAWLQAKRAARSGARCSPSTIARRRSCCTRSSSSTTPRQRRLRTWSRRRVACAAPRRCPYAGSDPRPALASRARA